VIDVARKQTFGGPAVVLQGTKGAGSGPARYFKTHVLPLPFTFKERNE